MCIWEYLNWRVLTTKMRRFPWLDSGKQPQDKHTGCSSGKLWLRFGSCCTQDTGMSPYGIFFLDFLIILHVADVVHPISLLF